MFKVHPNLVFLLVGCSIGVLAGTSCRRAIPDHCSSLNGDYTCRDRGSGMYCNACWTSDEVFDNEGCTDVMPSSDCRYEGVPDDAGSSTTGGGTDDGPTTGDSGDTTDGLTTDTEETGTGTESGSSTTGPTPCTGPEDCTEVATPYCGDEGLCVACSEAPTAEEGDAACAAADDLAPACSPDGACVTCTETVTQVCDEQLLLCDAEANTCIPCVEHADCVSGACHIAEGTCFPNDVSVAHVDEDGGQDFTSITAAIGAVADGGYGIIIVHELNGGVSYQPGFTVDGNKTLALFAESDENPIVLGTGGDPGLSITGAETAVYIEAVDFIGNTMDMGLVVDAGTAWVDRSRIVQNSGGGVLAQNGANLTLRNCMVAGTPNTNAVEVNGSTALVLYTTAVGNFGASVGLDCDAGSTVDVRNSIVVGRTDDLTCDTNTLTTSATLAELITYNEAWFDLDGGDLSLAGSADDFETVATWNDGDPRIDIDGDSRPEENGTPDVAGADVP